MDYHVISTPTAWTHMVGTLPATGWYLIGFAILILVFAIGISRPQSSRRPSR